MRDSYSKEEVRKIIEFACGYQRACDYELAGEILLSENPDSSKLLDLLYDTDYNNADEITDKDIEEFLQSE